MCSGDQCKRYMSYEERLKYLKWPTLEQRRYFALLTECYKTINKLNGLDHLDYFTFAHEYRPYGLTIALNSSANWLN